MSIRPVISTHSAQPTMEGAGVHLQRAFGFGKTEEFDPFLLLDDFRNALKHLGSHPAKKSLTAAEAAIAGGFKADKVYNIRGGFEGDPVFDEQHRVFCMEDRIRQQAARVTQGGRGQDNYPGHSQKQLFECLAMGWPIAAPPAHRGP